MQVAVDLLVDRLHDRGMAVPEVDAADPAGEVEVLPPLEIPDPGALGAGDDERRRRDPARDVLLSGRKDVRAAHVLLSAHRGRFYGRRGRETQKAADPL